MSCSEEVNLHRQSTNNEDQLHFETLLQSYIVVSQNLLSLYNKDEEGEVQAKGVGLKGKNITCYF